jgi:asparagine synthase (glutamine-hydrolysing)
MCGIVGYASLGIETSQLQAALLAACTAIHHRGPDSSGIVTNNNVGFGATRLAIRDVVRAEQPMTASDGTMIAYNGELYGVDSIRKWLIDCGHVFNTSSDTEVLLHGFREIGNEIFRRVSGMFAAAIWEPKSERLTLARDRWGEKPLYYAETPEGFAFASEPKALRAFKNINWNLSPSEMVFFLSYGYLASDQTGWVGVRKLLPGQIVTWSKSTITLTRYYTPKINPRTSVDLLGNNSVNLQTISQDLLALLERSVTECLVSERPVGVFLSGGIDSSSILALSRKYYNNIPSFSVSWKDSPDEDMQYAVALSTALGSRHVVIEYTPDDLCKDFDTVVAQVDELLTDSSTFPLAKMAGVAKNDVDVVLTGDGADELFGGYSRYLFNVSDAEYDQICRTIRTSTLQRLLLKDLLHLIPGSPMFIMNEHEMEHNMLSKRRLVDLHTFLPNTILTKVDRSTMLFGLEARAPYLHPIVSEWALQCQSNLLVESEVGKRILRVALNNVLPQSILNRPKKGFKTPLRQWFKEDLANWLAERLLAGSLVKSGWFRFSEIELVLREHQFKDQNHTRTLLSLAVLESWLRLQY